MNNAKIEKKKNILNAKSEADNIVDSNNYITSIYPLWRCFVKGISVTHVIVTLLPAAECDVRSISQAEDESERQNLNAPLQQTYRHQLQEFSSEQTVENRQIHGDHSQSGEVSPIPNIRIEPAVNIFNFILSVSVINIQKKK